MQRTGLDRWRWPDSKEEALIVMALETDVCTTITRKVKPYECITSLDCDEVGKTYSSYDVVSSL